MRSTAEATKTLFDELPDQEASSKARLEEHFERFWKCYPRRQSAGANPKKPAREEFERLVKRGVDPEMIIAGARDYAQQCEQQGMAGTAFVAHARTWLRQERFADHDIEETPPAQQQMTICGYTPAQLRVELDKAQRGWPHDRTAVRIALRSGVGTKDAGAD